MAEFEKMWGGITGWQRLTQKELESLETAWHTADLEKWEQYSVRPNVVVHSGATTDANAICTCHGEKGNETAAFIVMARNLMPLLISALRYGEEIS